MTANIIDKVKGIFKNKSDGQITDPNISQNPKSISSDINTQLGFLKSKFGKLISLDRIASPIIKLLDEDIISAKITLETYVDTDKRSKTIDSYTLDEKHSSINACVYFDKTKKNCIIGYRGTDIKDAKDISSDAQIILDIQGIDPRVQNALGLYDTIKREYQGYTLQVCGHSLGGTICYIIARHRNPSRSVVFNPGAFLSTSFVKMLEDTKRHIQRADNTYTYKILGDLISTFAFVGHTKVFSIKSTDPMRLHSVENFRPQQ